MVRRDAREKPPRLEVVDVLRGIVIVLMALDHVRDYFYASRGVDVLDLDATTPALFLTRWVTHFCAPTFVFLAGVSAWLQAEHGKTGWPLTRFLVSRGLWLIALEATLVSWAWQFWNPSVLVLQVIWAIGVSMLVLGGLCRLPVNVVLGIGVTIMLGHNALDPVKAEGLGAFGPCWRALHAGGYLRREPLKILVAYPVLPWIGIMACGYGLGRVFSLPAARRHRILHAVGWSLVVGFLLIRGLDVYGDPGYWSVHDVAWKTIGDFVDVKKYPPSLQYALMTLGPVLAALPWLERVTGRVAAFFLAFGRAPLFAYVVHLYLAHGLAMLLGIAQGHPAGAYVNPMFAPALGSENWGLSLAGTYVAWLVVVALLYGPTRWFAGVKARRRDWWLSYL